MQFVQFNCKTSRVVSFVWYLTRTCAWNRPICADVIQLVKHTRFVAHAYVDDLQLYSHVDPVQSAEMLLQLN